MREQSPMRLYTLKRGSTIPTTSVDTNFRKPMHEFGDGAFTRPMHEFGDGSFGPPRLVARCRTRA